jgi:hypothetical protein
VERYASGTAAGVGVGEATGVGVGEATGVGVGVDDELETEPQPMSNVKNARNKTEVALDSTRSLLDRDFYGQKNELWIGELLLVRGCLYRV